jgi:hypothetical protein
MTPETKVKAYLKRQCRARNWKCYTAPAAGVPFWPDKMIDCGNGIMWFCEIKAENTKHNRIRVEGQKKKLRELHGRGYPASFCVGNLEVLKMVGTVEIWMLLGMPGPIPSMGIY